MPPENDDAAIERILAATKACVDRRGARTTVTDVAAELSVTRQTVYRYFVSSEALLAAFAMREIGPFLDRLDRRVRHLDDPVEAMIEGLAYTVERLPVEPYAGVLLGTGRTGPYARITSETAVAFGRALVDRLVGDGRVAATKLDELVEWNLRVLQSLLLDPGHPPRRGRELRRYLDRWLVPSLRARLDPMVSSPNRTGGCA